MTGTDARLRRLLRDAKHDPLLREQAKAELARAGWSREALCGPVLEGLRRAFVDLMDYSTVQPGLCYTPWTAFTAWQYPRARGVGEVVTVSVWYPTEDDLIDAGGALDLRFAINASLKERSLAIECVEECFPGAVVVSSQVANGQKPPRLVDLKPIYEESA